MARDLPVHEIRISPPLNAAELEMLRKQDTWTISDEGTSLRCDLTLDDPADAIEWLEIFIERLRPGRETDVLVERGFTFDHVLDGIVWLRGHEEDAALIVEENTITLRRLGEPLNGLDWPAVVRAQTWLAEHSEPEAKTLTGLVGALLDHLRSHDLPEQLLDPADKSGS